MVRSPVKPSTKSRDTLRHFNHVNCNNPLLYERLGEEFFPELFRTIRREQLHQKLPRQMKLAMLIYYMNQAAGVDLVPFYRELEFNVRRLTRQEIESVIRQDVPSQ